MFWNTSVHQFSPRTVLNYGLGLLFCGIVFSLLGLHTEADATTITHDYTASFGSVAPNGPAPYASSLFDDGGSPGTVTLTVDVATTVGGADLAALYFNLDPSLDPNDLLIARTGGDGPASGDIQIYTGADAFMPDGDGMYDILIDMPPPGNRFEAGETLTFEISGIGTLVAPDFDFFATPSGGAGPFLSVARFLSTGGDEEGSDWVGAIPEPSTLVLLGLGSLALVVRRRGARA